MLRPEAEVARDVIMCCHASGRASSVVEIISADRRAVVAECVALVRAEREKGIQRGWPGTNWLNDIAAALERLAVEAT